MIDADVTLKQIPMYSVDSVPIELNLILYREHWKSGYGFQKEGKFKVEALRVIHINAVARTFRIRCNRGCEEVIRMSDGKCSTAPLYGKLDSAVRELRKHISEDFKACANKMLKAAQTRDHIADQIVLLGDIKEDAIKKPKEVKIN